MTSLMTATVLALGLLLSGQGLPAQEPASGARDSTAARPADDRWQITLGEDLYVWDIRLVRLDGDSLVVRQSDSLVRVPLAGMTEIRLIKKATMRDGGPAGGALAALMGADDEVYNLSPLALGERRRAVEKILRRHPAAS